MITTAIEGAVGTLTIDRPAKRNALTTAMLHELADGVRECERARVSVIVVRSSSAHFSAGADLTEWASPSPEEASEMSRAGVDAFGALAAAPMPTLAVIDGVAMGGGLELALACDLRLASTGARLSFPETGLGNVPAWGGVDRLVATVGRSRAMEMLVTATTVDGARAADLGLVNWAVDSGELAAEATRIVDSIVATDPRASALAKAIVGGSALDGVLASFTSQTPESLARKQAFLDRRTSTATPGVTR